jgi:hypothetical protein
VRARALRLALALGLAAVAAAGCAGSRIKGGVYHSDKGYRIAVPGSRWVVVDETRADLELRAADGRAAMLVNGDCRPGVVDRPFSILTRHLLAGLRDRTLIENDRASLDGRPTAHTVVEGHLRGDERRARIELYVVKDERCVYDLLYVAEPEVFDAGRDDFRRFVETLARE